ncbi:MAG: ABC transporter ATP-binding protein, partial [Deltaproteobacteria bacterium]|nr:ABC transporter ATP-binding protein [Deltaproteobacteria bacterium]
RWVVSGSFAAIFAEVAFRLIEPWPLGIVVDYVLEIDPGSGGGGTGPLGSLERSTVLWLAPAMLVLVVAARAGAAYLSAVGFAIAGNRVVTEVRSALYSHLQGLSLAFHRKARSGDLILRVIGDVGMVREVVVTAMLPLLGNLLILAGMVGVMVWMNWRLALVASCTAPLFWLSSVRLGRRIRRVAGKQRRREGTLATQAAEMLGAIQVVQALSLEDELAASFVRHNDGSLRDGVKAKRLSARLERTVDVITGVATALVLFVGARIVLSGGLTPGELVIFLSYLKSGFRPVRNFAKYTARLAKASAAADRVLEVLDQVPEVRERPDARVAPSFEGAVRFERAEFCYEDRDVVLRDIDFEVAPGEHIAIVGASGAGKTTLAAAIPRLHDPVRGRVSIDGCDIRDFTLNSLRSQIVVLLQESVLFATSLRQNIEFGAVGADDEAIEAAARLANAHEFISELPDGYETIVGERGERLSAGQRQRIAIARSALGSAQIVILDEPLAGLDEQNARRVREALDGLTRGRTTFLITHDLAHAASCDRIVVLDRNTIAEIGTHAELLARNGPYAALVCAPLSAVAPSMEAKSDVLSC